MNKHISFTFYLFFFTLLKGFSQSDCRNIGFEEGTFAGWLLQQGWVNALGDSLIYGEPIQRTYQEGHRIMSVADGFDPSVTDENAPVNLLPIRAE